MVYNEFPPHLYLYNGDQFSRQLVGIFQSDENVIIISDKCNGPDQQKTAVKLAQISLRRLGDQMRWDTYLQLIRYHIGQTGNELF